MIKFNHSIKGKFSVSVRVDDEHSVRSVLNVLKAMVEQLTLISSSTAVHSVDNTPVQPVLNNNTNAKNNNVDKTNVQLKSSNVPNVKYKFKCPSCKQSTVIQEGDTVLINSHDNEFKPSIYMIDDEGIIENVINTFENNKDEIHVLFGKLSSKFNDTSKFTKILITDDIQSDVSSYCPYCKKEHPISEWLKCGDDTSEVNCVLCGAGASIEVHNDVTILRCAKNDNHNIKIEV